jgi:hypothetical protein
MINRTLIGGILLLGLIHAGSAVAAAPWHQLSFNPPDPAPGEPFSLRLEGQMPDTCGVQFSGLSFEGGVLRVRLQRPTGTGVFCGAAVTPYTIDVDVTAAVGTIAVASSFPVHVELTDGSGTRDIAFALLTVADRDKQVEPEAGFWVADRAGRFATGGSGVGFNLEHQNGAIALIAYYYDSLGQPRWYFSAGPSERRSYRGELLEIVGGQQLFGDYRPPGDMVAFGNIDVAFQDNGRAEAWFSEAVDGGVLAEVRVQAVSLVRFGFRSSASTESLAGKWILVDLGRESGSGTVVNLVPAATLGTDHLRLEDTRTEVVVDCGPTVEQLDQPPASCSLFIADTRAATLDNNGFKELRNSEGNFRLLRLD